MEHRTLDAIRLLLTPLLRLPIIVKVIMYSGCPVAWCSKLQSEIALSTTKAEYIALSQLQ